MNKRAHQKCLENVSMTALAIRTAMGIRARNREQRVDGAAWCIVGFLVCFFNHVWGIKH